MHFEIELDGIIIKVIKKPIKNMYLRVHPPHGRISVSAPLTWSSTDIQHQLQTKMVWLKAQQEKSRFVSGPAIKQMESGEQHHLLGQAYTLTLIESEEKSKLTIENNLLLLQTKPKATMVEKKALLKKWYLGEMQQIVPDLIEKWQSVIGVHVKEWGAKTMKSRWGSCNINRQRIWLNLSLIEKPIGCLECVLVHEMVHLLESAHNARFYAFMDRFMPTWRIHQKALYEPN